VRARPDVLDRLNEPILAGSSTATRELSIDDLGLSTRLTNVLRRWDVRHVSDLEGHTWGEFSTVRGCGATSMRELDAVIERLDPQSTQRPRPTAGGRSEIGRMHEPPGSDWDVGYVPPPWESLGEAEEAGTAAGRSHGHGDGEVEAAVATVAAWALGRLPVESFGELLERGLGGGDVHEEVEAALGRLREVSLADLAGEGSRDHDAAGRLHDLLDGLPKNDEFVLERRLRPEPMTLEAIGVELGLTRERIRQIERRARSTVRAGVVGDRIVVEVASRIRERLGAVASFEHVDAVLASEVARLDDYGAERRWTLMALLLEQAGPYTIWLDGWLTTKAGADGLVAVNAKLDSDPPLLVEEADAAIRELGPGVGDTAELREALGFVEFAGCIVRRNLATGRLARVLLQQAGRPLEFDEIVAALGAEDRVKSVRNALLYDDGLARVDRRKFALAEWGIEPYTTVNHAITRALEARGGEASIEEIADEVAAKYSVQRSSVAAYARSVEFISAGRGRIRLRVEGELVEEVALRPLKLVPGCVRIDGRWAQRFTINDKHLRGFSVTVPQEFAAHLGADPLDGIELRTDADEVISVIRASLVANIGRLRVVCGRLGIEPGDQLFVIAPDDGGSVTFHTVRAGELLERPARERLALLYGLAPPLRTADLAASIDLHEDASIHEIVARLRARRESDAADLLDGTVKSGDVPADTEDATADDLANLLGL
jgi:hypothetical protein